MHGDYVFWGTVDDLSVWAIDGFIAVLDPGLSVIGIYSHLPLNYARGWAEDDLIDRRFSFIGELLAKL